MKKQEALTDNPPMKIYVNRTDNRITYKKLRLRNILNF